MTDVLLGQAYHLRLDPKLWDAMQPYPSLGSLYLASVLRSRGYSVAFHDSMLAESPEQWSQALDKTQPRFAVLYEDSFNYLSKMCLLRMREAAFSMIEYASQHDCTVIVSGSDATDHASEYLSRGAHFVMIGDDELNLAQLLQQLDSSDRASGVQLEGVVSGHDPAQPLRRNMPLRDLDELPRPAWDLVDIPRYRALWIERHGFYSVNMVTSRGCPYGCNWCAKPLFGRRYSMRSPRGVAEEMAELVDRASPDHIWFADDIFGLREGWIEEFALAVEELDVVTPFKCLLRTDLVTAAVAKALRRAGCETVWVGAESGSQKILDGMEKGATVQDTRRATRLLQAEGIQVGDFLQFGYLDEQWEDIQSTIELVRHTMPDDIGVSVSYPLPGTPFFERVREDLSDKQNWTDGDDLAMLYHGTFSTDFYRQLHKTLHRDYRLRKAIRDLKQGRLINLRHLLAALALPTNWVQLYWMRRRAGSAQPSARV